MSVDVSLIRAQPGLNLSLNQVIVAEGDRYRSKSSFFREQFFEEIQEIFREKLGIQNPRIFKNLWNQARDMGRITWRKEDPLTVAEFRRIEKALAKTLVFYGKGVEPEGSGPDRQVHEIVSFLIGQAGPSLEWINWRNIKGILFTKDPVLLKAMREELRIVLEFCSQHLPQPRSPDEPMFQTFVGNIVALLPFSYPEEGEEFMIPQKMNGIWRNCRYRIDKRIELTPKMPFSPIVCFGLTSEIGPPILTFLGTTFPAGDGWLGTVLADFTPGLSVGHAPYLLGRSNILKWLEGKSKARLFGASLGGALTLQVLRHHPDKVEQVNAYNPAGLYPWNWWGYRNQSEVNIYYQENDLVASMGMFPEGEGVNVFRVMGEKEENTLKAHARVYTGLDQLAILRSDSQYENNRFSRKALTLLHLFVGFALIFLPLLCFYLLFLFLSFLARPIFLSMKS